jgi:hypothetical protein
MIVDESTGRPATYEKVEPITPPSLDEYAGVYYSPELGISYTLAVEDGKLTVRRRKYNPATLVSLSKDTFIESSTEYSVDFQRDAAGAITGFGLTDGRVRNLRFERQPAS